MPMETNLLKLFRIQLRNTLDYCFLHFVTHSDNYIYVFTCVRLRRSCWFELYSIVIGVAINHHSNNLMLKYNELIVHLVCIKVNPGFAQLPLSEGQ